MRAWRRCRRKWWLGQYRGLQRPDTDDFNRPLSIGTRVHDVLAFYYSPGLERDPREAMDHLREGVESDVEANPAFEVDIRKEADLVEKMLDGYFNWLEESGADSDLKVVEPESEVEVELFEGATILSKIDARVERISDGRRGALEHKTVGSLTDPVRRLQVDSQLLTEHLVEYISLLDEGHEENRADFVLYNMLRKTKRTARAKPPFYAREEVRHNVYELRSHWYHVAAIAREILSATEKLDAGGDPNSLCYPNPTADCTWDCTFSSVCLGGHFDDGSEVEPLLEESYVEGDPLERYRSSTGLKRN